MKHNWKRDENGNINEWAWEAGFHNGVLCVDCGESVCVNCNPDYMELDDCTGPQKPKAVTNADRIRAFSDVELAEFISRIEIGDFGPQVYGKTFCDMCKGQYECDDCRLWWLQQLYEGE